MGFALSYFMYHACTVDLKSCNTFFSMDFEMHLLPKRLILTYGPIKTNRSMNKLHFETNRKKSVATF